MVANNYCSYRSNSITCSQLCKGEQAQKHPSLIHEDANGTLHSQNFK
jgi:hypothetical protein